LLKGKWGFINGSGQEVVPLKYDRIVSDFNKGKAEVELNGRTFFIDVHGKEVKEN